MNSLSCPKSNSLSHCLSELFPTCQNKHWTIRQRDDHFIDPLSHCIILKIVGVFQYPHLLSISQHMKNYISGCRLIGRVCTAEEHHLNSTDMQKQDGWRHQSSLCIRFLQTCALKLALSDVLCEIEAHSAAFHDQAFFYFPNKRPGTNFTFIEQ